MKSMLPNSVDVASDHRPVSDCDGGAEHDISDDGAIGREVVLSQMIGLQFVQGHGGPGLGHLL